MNRIYLPNIFRSNDYRKKINFSGKIPYYQEFKLGTDDLNLLLKVKTDKIIECLALYDIVYFDVFELPVVIDQLLQRDELTTKNLIRKGKISYVYSKDFLFGIKEHKSYVNLAAGEGSTIPIKNKNDLKKYLVKGFVRNDTLDNKCLKTIYRLSCRFTQNYFKDFLDLVNIEFREKGIADKLGVDLENGFYKQEDDGLISAYLEGRRAYYIAKNLNIEFVYVDDFIRDCLVSTNTKTQAVDNIIKLNQLLTKVSIPDISLMLNLSIIDYSGLMEILFKNKRKSLYDWIIRNNDGKDIMFSLLSEITGKPKSGLLKFMKNLGVSAIGIPYPGIGFLMGLISGLHHGANPGEEFVEISGKLKETIGDVKLPLVITEKYKKVYEIIED